MLAALYPNVAVMDDGAAPGRRPGWHDGGGEVALHPSCICHPLEAQAFHRPYLTYLEKVGWGVLGWCATAVGYTVAQPDRPSASLLCPGPQVRTSRCFIRDCTVASPAAILLFGGSLAVAHDSSYVQVDGWLRIRCGHGAGATCRLVLRAQWGC